MTAVAAAVALVAVGAGGAEAAHKITSGGIANNTIRSKDVHNDTIRSKDVHDDTIRSRDVHDHTLRGRDIHADTIGAGKLTESVRAALNRTGPAGPKGDTGPAGPAGPAGPPGAPGSGVTWALVKIGGNILDSGGAAAPTVHHLGTGIYCLSGPGWTAPATPAPYLVTTTEGIAEVDPDNFGTACTGAYGHDTIMVAIYSVSGTLTDSEFTIARLG